MKPLIIFHQNQEGLLIEIETERLYIRTYQNEDFEQCVTLYGNERLARFFDHGKPRSRDEVEELVAQRGISFSMANQPFGLFSIFLKEQKIFIGQFDILPAEESGTVEMGCIFLREYQGQGFFPEVSKVFLFDFTCTLNEKGYTYNGSPIQKVIVTTHPKNYSSKKIIESIGMEYYKTESRFGHPRLWYSYDVKSFSL